MKDYRNEEILKSIIKGTPYTDPPMSRIEDLLLQVKAVIEQGGGGGGTGVSVKNVLINESGHLICTLSNGNIIDAGYCIGPQGEQGIPGTPGADGEPGQQGIQGPPGASPSITVKTNTPTTYILTITNADGSHFDTANLHGSNSGSSGVIYHLFSNDTYEDYLDDIYISRTAEKSVESLATLTALYPAMIGEDGQIIMNNNPTFGWAEMFYILSLSPVTLINPSYFNLTYTGQESDTSSNSVILVDSDAVDASLTAEQKAEAISAIASDDTSPYRHEIMRAVVFTTAQITQATELSFTGEYYIVFTAHRDNESLSLYKLDIDARI